jgi:DNA-directed RNA polymerase specialized sigma24 family protein
MPEETSIPNASLISRQPLPECAEEFVEKMHGLLDGQPKDEAAVAGTFEGMDGMFDRIASGLYSIASMLVGEGEDSIQLVETAVTNADLSRASDAEDARRSGRRALVIAAIELIAERDPASLGAPEGLEHAVTCIDDDDLDAAAEAREALERMIAGPDRDRVRNWLESLPPSLRTIFVMRAVAGFTAPETAGLLAAHGGPQAAGWNAEAVKELFRQALCSLASQLIHATAGK